MSKEYYLVIETYDEEKDLREKHRVTFEQFKNMLLRRWPELDRALKIASGKASIFDLMDDRN